VTDLSAIDAAHLADAQLTLQTSVHYLHLDWGLDGLISLYLSDSEPESYELDVNDTWLELRGVRGDLRMNRLTRGAFTFRAALLAGATLGDAAVVTIKEDPGFDPGAGLVALLSEGLVAAISGANDVRRAG
jgi:hypothetical protein